MKTAEYRLPPPDRQILPFEVEMPWKSQILGCAMRGPVVAGFGGRLVLWVTENPAHTHVKKKFCWVGMDREIPVGFEHVATIQIRDGWEVWSLYVESEALN